MTVGQLIKKLQAVPADWHISGTGNDSICVREPLKNNQYGWVFTDDRETRICERRKWRT